MSRKLQTAIERWLSAEARDDTGTAEVAFGAVFAALPRLAPRRGFAERVMWRVEPALALRPRWMTWGGKAVTASALALAALALVLLPAVGLQVEFPAAVDAIDGVARGVAWVAGWVMNGLEAWGLMARVGRAIGVAVSTPPVAAALMASALVGGLALYELNRLLVPERRAA